MKAFAFASTLAFLLMLGVEAQAIESLEGDRVEQDLEAIKSRYRNSPEVLRILEEASFTELP